MVVEEIHSYYMLEDGESIGIEFTLSDDDVESNHTVEIFVEDLESMCDLFDEVDWVDYTDDDEFNDSISVQRNINISGLQEGLTLYINQNKDILE
jgi:hypothetical protein